MIDLINKNNFIGIEEITWLYSGAETPPLRGALEAVTDYMNTRSLGSKGRERNSEIEWNCKTNLAKLLNGKPEDIAILSNASEIISMIASSFPFNPGDNVVINELEFPSGVLPWLALKEKGIEVRIVKHNDWKIEVNDVLNLVDNKTRLVMASHVSYLSGARLDYKRLYKELLKTDTFLLLDVTQSLGVISVDMQMADFVVSSSYKWLMSIHGGGVLAVNSKRIPDFSSKCIGWRSVSDMFSSSRLETYTLHEDARKFELGYPSYPMIYSLNYSSELLLNTGINNIEKYILLLGEELISQLESAGYTVMTPHDPEKRAGNISFKCENAEVVAESLANKDVFLWGGDGRLRASIHAFNNLDDIKKLITLLNKAQ